MLYNASVVKPNDPWTDLSNMKVPRKHHLCQTYNLNGLEVVLAVGGMDSSSEVLNTVEVFYRSNGLWGILAAASLPRYIQSSALVNINNRMHLIGGLESVYPQSLVWTHHSSYGWRRSNLRLQSGIQNHVAFSLKADMIDFKGNHIHILILFRFYFFLL